MNEKIDDLIQGVMDAAVAVAVCKFGTGRWFDASAQLKKAISDLKIYYYDAVKIAKEPEQHD